MVAPNGWNLGATGETLQSSVTVMTVCLRLHVALFYIFFLGKNGD
jgi:hypothetical protein